MLSHTVDARVINAGPSSSSSSSAPRCRALLVGVVKEVFVVERGSGVKRLRRSPTPQMISRLGRAACRMSPLNHHLSNAQGSAKMQRTTPGHAHPLTTHTTEDETPKGPQHAQSQRSREGGWGELDLCALNRAPIGGFRDLFGIISALRVSCVFLQSTLRSIRYMVVLHGSLPYIKIVRLTCIM